MTGALGILQELILHSPGLLKSYKKSLLEIAYILGLKQSLKPSTHHVLLTEQGGPRFVEHLP